jgi:hypothetical protein
MHCHMLVTSEMTKSEIPIPNSQNQNKLIQSFPIFVLISNKVAKVWFFK